MAATPGNKANKGWGTFLTNAVSGLESKLDNILADEGPETQKAKVVAEARRAEVQKAVQKTVDDDARPSSRARPNNRLQERLAKAVNKTPDGSRSASRAPVAEDRTPPAQSPGLKTDATPRISTDSQTSHIPPELAPATTEAVPSVSSEGTADEPPQTQTITDQPHESSSTAIPSLDLPPETTLLRPSQESTRVSVDAPSTTGDFGPTPSLEANAPPHVQSAQHDDEDCNRTLEMHAHLEKIDALQSKLKYLARAAADAAKEAAADAEPGSLEKRLAEKEEQISLLMEEGLRMSKTELRLQNAVKEMRKAKVEREKGEAELKRRLERLEREKAEAVEGRRKAEAQTKDAEARVAIVNRIEKDVDELKREKEQASELIRDLRRQLADSVERAEEADKRAQSDKLETERRKVQDLKDELDNVKIEKKLHEDRLRAEVREAKEESARQRERAKMAEEELRIEVTSLETKLELLRARTEEATSSATGDSQAQAKLLRQIETLQTQYALASENWAGIESTLTARVAALDKERDDISKRESDVRKKAREVNSKARKLEEELEAVNERASTLEQDLAEQNAALEKLQARAERDERALEEARRAFEREKSAWEGELQAKIEEERVRWRIEMQGQNAASAAGPGEALYVRTDLPTISGANRKTSGQDFGLLGSGFPSGRRPTSSRGISAEGIDRPPSRRTSAFPTTVFGSASVISPMRVNSLNSLNGTSHPGSYPAPSIDAILDDDAVSETPVTGTSSPRRRSSHVGTPVADLVSVSTVNAGPSVQLVERMSAAVRRLESEKASLKEELSRLSGQRDEARKQVVVMMRDAEATKGVEERLKAIEAELGQVKDKWDRTLEVLGEREEECEELRNDVLDLKGIIRDMAEERAT